jgi:hypothetical protein
MENIRDNIEYKDLNFASVFKNNKACKNTTNNLEKSLKRTSICSKIIHHTLNTTQIDSERSSSLYHERNKQREKSIRFNGCDESLRSPKHQSYSQRSECFFNLIFKNEFIFNLFSLIEIRCNI